MLTSPEVVEEVVGCISLSLGGGFLTVYLCAIYVTAFCPNATLLGMSCRLWIPDGHVDLNARRHR